MRAWRNSNVAVRQSAVPGAIPGARTNCFGAVVFKSQHSGLLIRTVRVQLTRFARALGPLLLERRSAALHPPAPPNLTRGH